MAPNPLIVKSVEQLDYRVTVGDVASAAGLEINLAQQGLLALASDAGGHLQVAEDGEIVYLFPQNFRTILRNKYWRLRLKEWWEKVWKVLFYLIRISFGIILIVSILIMLVAISILIIAISSSRSDNNSGGGSSDRGGDTFFFPFLWSPDIFWLFNPSYDYDRYQQRERYVSSSSQKENQMNFLEAIFSFLFGDGNPNYDLEERRWGEIGGVIRSNGGAIVAEQIAPYLDKIEPVSMEDEDYILPVLARFNGYPEVSPAGEIIYYFPELQVTATQRDHRSLSSYLQEYRWYFSQAGSGQILLAIGLGGANLILALVLGNLLQGDIAAQIGGLVAFVNSIYLLLLGYGIAFLGIPLIRYFWVQWKNDRIETRNQKRLDRASLLERPDDVLTGKINYARQFAQKKVIGSEDITYSTEQDLLEQDIERSDKIDREWQERLESGS
ncbi:MAG: hypothetical protein QNJ54_15855 [Prochloraceae cyanobacterium]|nr:hypothetical protein [Prochloraceae cyanobacterium]